MTCEICQQTTSTVHLTMVVEQDVTKIDLCERCAREKGVHDPDGFALTQLLREMSQKRPPPDQPSPDSST